MAILLDPSRQQGYFSLGTLAVVPLAGGTPRELLENVGAADWTPDGRDLCVARLSPKGDVAIELPPGKVLDWVPRSRGLSHLRVSPDGRYVAFQAGGRMKLADREREVVKTLAELGANFWGLAWAPSGREVWFTEGASWGARDVHAVDLEGRRRLVYRSTGVLAVMDVAPDGRPLLHRAFDHFEALALLPGGRAEQDVTVSDHSTVGALSADGRLLLLNSLSGGAGNFADLRRDGGDPVRLAAGTGTDISPDGRSTLVVADGELTEVPIGAGLSRKIDAGSLRVARACFLPHSPGGLMLLGRERTEPEGLWVIDREGAPPRKLDIGTPMSWAIAPDGRHVAVKTEVDIVTLVPLAGGPARAIRGLGKLSVTRWSGDGRSLFLARAGGRPCEIHRLDLATETVALWKQVAPSDLTGVLFCTDPVPSADGQSYAYAASRSVASLIVAEGLR